MRKEGSALFYGIIGLFLYLMVAWGFVTFFDLDLNTILLADILLIVLMIWYIMTTKNERA